MGLELNGSEWEQLLQRMLYWNERVRGWHWWSQKVSRIYCILETNPGPGYLIWWIPSTCVYCMLNYYYCVSTENCYAWGVIWRRYWSWGESNLASKGLSAEPHWWHRAGKNRRTGAWIALIVIYNVWAVLSYSFIFWQNWTRTNSCMTWSQCYPRASKVLLLCSCIHTRE